MGLTERQAAAHLLSRFTFGETPGQIDAVVNMGLEKWFEQQLNAGLPDDSLDRVLDKFDALKLSNAQISALYPTPATIIRLAVKDGVISKDSAFLATDKKVIREKIMPYALQKGYKQRADLLRQFFNQKILRAAYSNNQLQEVLTDFWFNHFYVSMSKPQAVDFIPDYERDVIRPNALGKFDQLLLASAKSPAMLYYLDLAISVGPSTIKASPYRLIRNQGIMTPADSARDKLLKRAQNARKTQGLNENYAREVMELHTMGVDGGYTQADVTQAARVLTGWAANPMREGDLTAMNRPLVQLIENRPGVVHDGDFLFIPNRHDMGEKVVLGKTFAANGGYQEGVDLLEMLAHNPATAKFITKKLAVRFVSDTPPQSLLDKMSKSFIEHDGDIKQVLITMASAPEFWNKQSLREKIKSPFELAISSVRALNATVDQPYQLYQWVTKMGQQMYYYQAPTGFPDKAQYWINTGALLNRMNFGLALATQRIPGIKFDLAALNNHHEPESMQAALAVYGKILLPERDLGQTIKFLTPMLNDPKLADKVDAAAVKTAPVKEPAMAPDMMMGMSQDMMMGGGSGQSQKRRDKPGNIKRQGNVYAMASLPGNNTMLSQVVGIIIGSPEYQRR